MLRSCFQCQVKRVRASYKPFPNQRKVSSLANFNQLPLCGIKPYCTQILGDLGAEIVKVEHPTRGDDTRQWGPPYAPDIDGSDGPGESAYYLSVNRNKKSIGVSFKTREGQAIISALAEKADVFVENYLPGTLQEYGLDYSTLKKSNPKIIYASITGYGQTGPSSNRAGYDVMVEANGSDAHNGESDGPPVKVGCAVTDLTTGLYTSNSIMAALIGRAKTGEGQHIDVALSDCQVATLSNMAESVLISGKRDSGRWGTAHPSVVPHRAFKTLDGDVLFGGGNDRLFRLMCIGLGKPEWAADERFSTNSARVENRRLLEPWIEEITRTKKTGEWLSIFDGTGLPYAKVNDIFDTVNHKHVLARNMIQEINHPSCGPIKLINPPVKFSRVKPRIRSPPPTIGQHTNQLLQETLGLTDDEVIRLRKRGIIS